MYKFFYPITPVGYHISPYNIPIKPGMIEQPIEQPRKPSKPDQIIYIANIPNGRKRVYKSAASCQRAYDRYHREQAKLKAIEARKATQQPVENLQISVDIRRKL